MSPTFSLKEVAIFLNKKDVRSVEKWCKKNNVKIFSDEGNNKKYVIRMQFEYARMKKFIQYLKAKHNDKWLEAFNVYSSKNILQITELEETGKVSTSGTIYQPVGEHELKFLSRLSEKINEL